MKQTLSRIFLVFMSLVVLMSNTGIGVIEHSCLMRGNKVSISTKKVACCADKKQHLPQNSSKTIIKKTKCCKDEDKYQNVEFSSSISQLVAKFVQTLANYLNFTINFCFNIFSGITISLVSSSKISAPPPMSGREILAFVQSFLI